MGATEALLANNRAYADTFAYGDAPLPPARGVAVLTCMDARIHPDEILGLAVGDAHVIRNAGGRASDDALRSLIISSHLLGTTEYLVIHHTDCGMCTFTNDELHARLAEATGADASAIDFLPFDDLDESVREDVDRIRDSPLVPSDVRVTGWIYDVGTGRLTRVQDAPA